MNHKIKVLFVNGHLDVGGVEKSLYDLLTHWDYSKYDVDLLLLERRGVYAQNLPNSVNVIVKDTENVWGAFGKVMRNNLKKGQFSNILFRIVYEFSNTFSKQWLRFLSPILGIKKEYDYAIAYRVGFPNYIVAYAVNSMHKICWWHHGECVYDLKNVKRIKESWRRMNTIVTVSEGTRYLVKKVFAIDDNKIRVIPNMVDIAGLEKKANVGIPFEYNNHYFKIVTIGRLSKEKHIEDVPHIAEKMIERGFDYFVWYIVGDGEQKKRIKELIISKRLGKRILMLGEKENPYPYIKYADLLVHTSHVEAHCLTLLEAMSLRTLCVATRTVIPQDFTKDMENCLLVDQNIQSQVNGILDIVVNQIKAAPMIESAHHLVCDCYSPSIIISKIEDLLI